jgi:hypothetical protein
MGMNLVAFSQSWEFTGPCNKGSGEMTQTVGETDAFELRAQVLNFPPYFLFLSLVFISYIGRNICQNLI